MRVIGIKDGKWKKVKDGIEMKVLAYGGNLMMTVVRFQGGVDASSHSHPHEQISFVLKGKFIYGIEDKKYEMNEGDSIYVPSNVMHYAKALTDGILVDVFTPIRGDFL